MGLVAMCEGCQRQQQPRGQDKPDKHPRQPIDRIPRHIEAEAIAGAKRPL
jgi:hypothetical protein